MERQHKPACLCIVGRPNVGKSSIFNWLLGERKAVVLEESGTTRDRAEALVNIRSTKCMIVDTGGYLTSDKDHLSKKVKDQIRAAIGEATALLMVVSTIDGIVPADREVIDILRKYDKPIILVANKADNAKLENDIVEFYQLGLGAPLGISCVHKRGLKELKGAVYDVISKEEAAAHNDESGSCIKIAVVGRPNVGKSSYINFILNNDRVIVSDIPGTTRDSIDIFFNDGKNDYILIDTAGIRHKRKIKTVVDVFSIMRSQGSIRRADVVVFMVDAADGFTSDDISILRYVKESGKACMILVNKWDLASGIEGLTVEDYENDLIKCSPMLRIFPVYFISAKTGKNVFKSFSLIEELNRSLDEKLQTATLNKTLKKNDPSNVAVPRSKKRPNFKYITQTGTRPIELTYFVNDIKAVTPKHCSYIENKIREVFHLDGIPIKLVFKSSSKQVGEK